MRLYWLSQYNPQVEYNLPIETINAPPDIPRKSGYHLVLSESDLPKLEEPSPVGRALPRTLLAIHTAKCQTGIEPGPLGKAVCQLLASGSVNYEKFLSLWLCLTGLAREYDRLHRELQSIPVDTLRQADEAVAGKK